MEYSFKLSELFPEEISIIGNDLLPLGCPTLKENGERVVRERITEILDTMGRASADAQLLPAIVTSANQLRGGDYKLYIYCDFIANKVVGFLKIGKKKLSLFENSGIKHEIEPLCILDFHIVESRQRHGAGKYLFDFMLRKEGIPVEHFAIDSPTDKFLSFLKKHYKLTNVFPQINNFCLFDGFFLKRSEYSGKKEPWHGTGQTAEVLQQKKESPMEDSLEYNHHEPPDYLRHGSQMPYYVQRTNDCSPGDTPHPHQQPHEKLSDEHRLHVSSIGYGYAATQQHGHQHDHGSKDDEQKEHVFSSTPQHFKDDGERRHFSSIEDIPQSHQPPHEKLSDEHRLHVSSVGYGYSATQQHHQQDHENKIDRQMGHVTIGDNPQPHQQQHEKLSDEHRLHVSSIGYGHAATQENHQQDHESKDDGQKRHASSKKPHQQPHEKMSDEHRQHVSSIGYGYAATQQHGHQHDHKSKDDGKTEQVFSIGNTHQQDKEKINDEQRRHVSAVGNGDHPYGNGEEKSQETHNFM